MTDETQEPSSSKQSSPFTQRIDAKAKRMMKARKNRAPEVWLGLGMMGLIGWSVTVPALVGAMIGVWLDRNYPGNHSWTLALLVMGLAIGCMNAWHWVAKEEKAMRDEQENERE
jgi:ATP synthase protein I